VFEWRLRLKTQPLPLYNLGRNYLPDLESKSAAAPSRRWTIMAAALLLFALTLVVIYTSRAAFFSPLALVVVAAIGLSALLLQLRLRHDIGDTIRAPLSLNVLGVLLAVAAIVADVRHSNGNLLHVAAFGAVACFAISGVLVLRALRKKAR
jgi:hypothetical protein